MGKGKEKKQPSGIERKNQIIFNRKRLLFYDAKTEND